MDESAEMKIESIITRILHGLVSVCVAIGAFFLKDAYNSLGELNDRITVIEHTRWSLQNHLDFQQRHEDKHMSHAQKHTEMLILIAELQTQIGKVIERQGMITPEAAARIEKIQLDIKENRDAIRKIELRIASEGLLKN